MVPRVERDVGVDALKQAQRLEEELRCLALRCAGEPLFVSALVAMAIVEVQGRPWDLWSEVSAAHAERLAPLLIGAPRNEANPDPKVVRDVITVADQLLSASIEAQLYRFPNPAKGISLLNRISADLQVIRGSGEAEQIEEQIRSIAGSFNRQFERELGASATDLLDVLRSIGTRLQQNVDLWLLARLEKQEPPVSDAELLGEIVQRSFAAAPVARQDIRLRGGSVPAEQVWDALLSLIGFTSQHTAGESSFQVARTRPLFVLSDGRVILAALHHCLDCLWNALDSCARSTVSLKDDFQDRKSRWLEEKTAGCLKTLFGPDRVFLNLEYPNPDKGGEDTTELDVGAQWGPFVIFAEVKARQLRLQDVVPDRKKLKKDLKKNIDEAFEQALRARRYVASVDTPRLREKSTRRLLTLKRNEIKRIYLVTVTFNPVWSAINGLIKLREFGLFTKDEFPWAVDWRDLELVTEFSDGPDVFLHYLERRVDIEQTDRYFMNFESELFAAYLRNRLHPNALGIEGKHAHFVNFRGWDKKFHDWRQFQRGIRPSAPKVELDVPTGIDLMLRRLRNIADNAAAQIAFAFLGLPYKQLLSIERGFFQTMLSFDNAKRGDTLVVPCGDLVVCFVTAAHAPQIDLAFATGEAVLAAKYQLKVSRAVGFGIADAGRLPFDYHFWSEFSWRPDSAQERAFNFRRLASMPIASVRPKRNDPCPCGSGKKFKHCHLRN
jgi:hypothetical protein